MTRLEQRTDPDLKYLEAELAESQLRLATVRAELDAFYNNYMRRLGPLYAQLDRLKAEIANQNATRDPLDADYRKAAAEANERAEASARELHDEKPEQPQFRPSEELKNAYRRAALKIHPDFANDEQDRKRRNRAWLGLQEAYKNSDVDGVKLALEKFLAGDTSSEDARQGEAQLPARLDRLRDMIARLKEGIEMLENSDVAKLKAIAERRTAQGDDYLAEKARELSNEIEMTKLHLAAIRLRS